MFKYHMQTMKWVRWKKNNGALYLLSTEYSFPQKNIDIHQTKRVTSLTKPSPALHVHSSCASWPALGPAASEPVQGLQLSPARRPIILVSVSCPMRRGFVFLSVCLWLSAVRSDDGYLFSRMLPLLTGTTTFWAFSPQIIFCLTIKTDIPA